MLKNMCTFVSHDTVTEATFSEFHMSKMLVCDDELFPEIYFGSSFNDRTLILLEERCTLKQSKFSMFLFLCGYDGHCRIKNIDGLTFLGTKNRTFVVPSLEIYCVSSFEDSTLIICRKVGIQSISNMHVSVF